MIATTQSPAEEASAAFAGKDHKATESGEFACAASTALPDPIAESATDMPDVLFVMFKDVAAVPDSGSSVRPLKMLQAFKNIGCKVTLLEGLQNDVARRHKNVRRIIDGLKEGKRYDCCYVEPPSGPLFCPTDLTLLKELKRREIPVGLFYRDAYHLFHQNFSQEGRLKEAVIRHMAHRDFKTFSRTCEVAYVPSRSFGELVGFPIPTKPLPPACAQSRFEAPVARNGKGVAGVYVGAASKEYGTFLLLEAFDEANRLGSHADLTFVCPPGQWESLPEEYRKYRDKPWLSVVQAKGNELEEHYRTADFGIMPRLRTPYNDIAAPVKMVEYISHGLPVLSTDCTECKNFVETWGIGKTVQADPDSMARGIAEFAETKSPRNAYREALLAACRENTWEKRAQTVIKDLCRNSRKTPASA